MTKVNIFFLLSVLHLAILSSCSKSIRVPTLDEKKGNIMLTMLSSELPYEEDLRYYSKEASFEIAALKFIKHASWNSTGQCLDLSKINLIVDGPYVPKLKRRWLRLSVPRSAIKQREEIEKSIFSYGHKASPFVEEGAINKIKGIVCSAD